MSVKARATPAIANLFFFVRGYALVCSERVKSLEYKTAGVAEELMKPHHPQQYDSVVVVSLNALALAPRAPHRTILANTLGYNGQRSKSMPEETKSKADVDPLIEAYKKDVDVTLIRENLRLTVDQRFQQLMKLQEFAEELRRAGRKAREEK